MLIGPVKLLFRLEKFTSPLLIANVGDAAVILPDPAIFPFVAVNVRLLANCVGPL